MPATTTSSASIGSHHSQEQQADPGMSLPQQTCASASTGGGDSATSHTSRQPISSSHDLSRRQQQAPPLRLPPKIVLIPPQSKKRQHTHHPSNRGNKLTIPLTLLPHPLPRPRPLSTAPVPVIPYDPFKKPSIRPLRLISKSLQDLVEASHQWASRADLMGGREAEAWDLDFKILAIETRAAQKQAILYMLRAKSRIDRLLRLNGHMPKEVSCRDI